MASPFKIFRKYQKLALAALGVLVIIGFVILPAILQGLGEPTVVNPRVATTKKHGEITRTALGGMRWQRERAVHFLNSIQQAVLMAGGDAQAVRMALQEMAPDPEISPTSEEAVIDTWLLAERAQRLGFVVDDATVAAFIREISQGYVSTDQIASILGGMGITDNHLFAALRQELLAMHFRASFVTSISGATPAERWDYFQRLNRGIKIEAVPIQVKNFADKVPDPGDKALEEFFEEHKTELDDPNSPEIGFRKPKKVAVEYLKAEYEKFFNEEVAKVTAEEVQEYYEENKENYREEELPTLDEEEPNTSERGEAAEGETLDPDGPADDAAAPDGSADAEAAGEQEASSEEETSNDQETPPDAPADESAEGTDPADMSGSSRRSPFRLTSLLQEADQSELSTTEPSTTAQPTAESEAGSEPMPEAASPEAPTAESPAVEEPSAEPPTAENPDATPADDSEVAAAPPKYKPLEEVEDEIRRILARPKTIETIQNVLNGPRGELEEYGDRLVLYKVEEQDRKGDEMLKKPDKPDFKDLAQKHGLVAGDRKLLADYELDRWGDIGKSSIDRKTSFIDSAFGSLPLNEPEISQDEDRDLYLYWKTAEDPGGIPDFNKDVRKRVLEAWKMDKALGEAKEDAKNKVDKAKKKPLKEAFGSGAGLPVLESEPFTWMTYGAIPKYYAQGPPRLSDIQVTDAAGNESNIDNLNDEFMRAVFDLQVGQVGIAVNTPKTVVYVVRVAESNPSRDLLWMQFVSEDYRFYYLAGSRDHGLAYEAWMDSIRAEAGFQWDPDWERESASRRRE